MKLTKKQDRILRELNNNDDWHILINHGAKRSGKTVLDNLLFLKELARVRQIADEDGVDNPQYILAGFTLSNIRQNIITELMNWGINISYDRYNNFKLLGVSIVQTSTGNISGIGRIRGMTAYGAYINEASLCNPEVFDEIIARCSGRGARIICDTNPDHPEHWLKKDYIDNKKSKRILNYHFSLDDNELLDPDYKKNIKLSTPQGMLYDRAIKGLWVSGKGSIYGLFDREKHYMPFSEMKSIHFERYVGGVDFGFSEGHNGVVLVFGVKNDKYYLLEEHAHTGLYIDAWCDIALKLIDEYGDMPFFCDSARPEHVAKMRDKGIQAILANKKVLAGIEHISKLFYQSKLYISEDVKVFKKEIYNYVWNERTGEPVKENDDVMDAMRYALYTDSIVNAGEELTADEGAEKIHKLSIY